MKNRLRILTILLCIMMLFVTSTFCGLGGTKEENEILEKVLNGEISEEEGARLENALPIEKRSKDVQEAAKLYGDGGSTTSQQSTTSPATVAPTPTPSPKKTCSHVYNSVLTKEPNCTEEGLRTFTCEICGDTYEQTEPTNDEHDYIEERVEPTCTENGSVTYTCSRCGDTYSNELESTGHTFEYTVTKEPTCTEMGEQIGKCTVCGVEETNNLPELGHKEGDWEVSKNAGLFTSGEKVKKCIVCGEILEKQETLSKYPVAYLYFGIAGAAFLIAVILILVKVISKVKKEASDN